MGWKVPAKSTKQVGMFTKVSGVGILKPPRRDPGSGRDEIRPEQLGPAGGRQSTGGDGTAPGSGWRPNPTLRPTHEIEFAFQPIVEPQVAARHKRMYELLERMRSE